MTDTLDPEQIRKLPVDRTQPYNGLTEAQVRAIGADPAEVETARLGQLEWEKANRLQEEARLVLAAQHAVEIGDITPVEAALALRQGGRQAAHDVFVQGWHADEHADDADADAEFLWADADEYLRRTGEIDAAAAVKAADEAAAAKAAEQMKVAEQIRAKLDATVPEGHPLRAGVEAAIVMKLNEDDAAASDERGQNQLIRGAVQKAGVLDSAVESIRQQAEQEWRILRKTQGKSDGLMTAADIEAAKEHYIGARLQQLGDRTMVNHDDLKAPPTAEEEKQRYIGRIEGRNSRSTSLHEAVGEIAARGREAEARRGASAYGSGSERERFRESVRRAEEKARVGAAPEAAASRNPDHPELPPSWADEYGPAGYSAA